MKSLPFVVLSLVLVGCGASNSIPTLLPGKPALLVNEDGTPLRGSIFWDGDTKPAILLYKGVSQFNPKLVFEINNQGMDFSSEYKNGGGGQVPYDASKDCLDVIFKNGCYVQFGLVNFDKSGNPNVVVAIGNGSMVSSNLHVDVLRYHPPGSASDLGRDSNWEVIGSFRGQAKAIITDKDVGLMFGSQGEVDKYVFAEGRFFNFSSPVPAQSQQVVNSPVPQPAQPVSQPQPQQEQSAYTLAAGAPECPDFKSAITLEAVEQSGNELAINSFMDREGCNSSSQPIHLYAGSTIEQVGNGVVFINTPSGVRVYTLQQDISTN